MASKAGVGTPAIFAPTRGRENACWGCSPNPPPLDKMSRGGGSGEQPQQAFLRPRRGGKNSKCYTLALLAVSAYPESGRFLRVFAPLVYPLDKSSDKIVIAVKY